VCIARVATDHRSLTLVGMEGGLNFFLSSLCSDLREMAPVPISNMKPIVKITKNNTATQNP